MSFLSSPGVVGFTNLQNTAAPNGAIPVSYFFGQSAAASVDVAVIPKGNGALLAAIPDGTAVGGNKRGTNAIDFSIIRSAAANVASGSNSVIVGNDSIASANGAVALGFQNQATNTFAAALGGSGCIASGSASVAVGSAVFATGLRSSAIGGNANTADGTNSSIVGGIQAITRGITNAEARACGNFTVTGDCQRTRHLMRRQTTDATANVVLTTDGAGPGANNLPILGNNIAAGFQGSVMARNIATGAMGFYTISGALKRGANAAATALVGAPTVTTIQQEAGLAGIVVAVVADAAAGGLNIQVTGLAATNIDWQGDLTINELG